MGPVRQSDAGGSRLPVLLRGIASLVLLLGLLGGLPVGLFLGTRLLAGVDGLSLHGGLTAFLSRPDQGQLFVWALAVVGWIAWACFALSAGVELRSRLRGLPAPRIPALGWSQRGVAALLGAVFALLPAAGAMAADAAPAVAVHAAATVAPRPVAAEPAVRPGYTVQDARPAETLWSIAERQLGSGDRWTEIARLNEGAVVAPDGSVFRADAALRPGWTLSMPPHAPTPGPVTTPHPAPAPSGAVGPGAVVVVRAGDTLAGIAARHGLPGGWQALYAANRQVIGPDPDLIQPGVRLTLPGTAAVATPGEVDAASIPAPSTTAPASGPAPAAAIAAATAHHPEPGTPLAPGSEPARASSLAPGPGAPSGPVTPPGSVSGPTPAPAAAPASAGAPAPAAARADAPVMPAAGVGAAGFLAASLLGLLARNRRVQQRSRRPRRRIPLPDGSAEQRFEAALHAAADPVNLDLLDRTLRTLGMSCLTTGAELPALAAVAVHPDGTVDLHLAEPAAGPEAAGPGDGTSGIAPFRPLEDGRIWRCRTADAELLDPEQARDVPAPYPALVTLGRDRDGAHVLVDLEQIRHLRLDGSPAQVAAVVRALVVELAATPLADPDQLTLTALGSSVPLVGTADLDRLRTEADAEHALLALSAHRRAVERVLTACQMAHPRAARSRGVATASWAPALLCTDEPLSPDETDLLGWALAGREHSCLAAVTPVGDADDGAGRRLHAGPGYQRIGTGLPFEVALQRLDEAEFAAALRLLAVSVEESDRPAPEWTGHDPEDPYVFPVLATRSAATAGADPASATAVPLLSPDIPSAFTAPSLPGVGPRLLLLGPLRLTGATGVAAPARMPRLTAVAAYLALHPDPALRAGWQAEAVLGPERSPERAETLSLLRDWLGPDAHGAPCLDVDSARLHPAVSCDWTDFQQLYRQGMNAHGMKANGMNAQGMHGVGLNGVDRTADSCLRAALDLVRAAPFAGASMPELLCWVEPFRQDMLAAVVDAAYELAMRLLVAGDHDGCERALHHGMAAVPEAESLHRGLIRLYRATGRRDHLSATLTQLAQINASLGRHGYEPETVELFDLISGRHPRTGSVGPSPQPRLHLPQGAS
ncbi:LysM peptidoglycan-binding domain-containing protein [Streptacidiphilus sp. EB129]|uniref:LysM peptidoglycan-binding domain-containing protein n=1 Tax=Streptacidiphilus sp. EB129 TaxID=3156262 RepID=UPI003514B943